MSRLVAAFAALAVLAAGCASRGSVRDVRKELSLLRTELSGLRQDQQDAAGRHAEVEAALRTLTARVEELDRTLAAARAQATALETRLAGAESDLKRVRDDLAARPVTLVPPPPAAAPAPHPPRTPVPPPTSRPLSAEAAYQAALATFRAREHGQAVLEFLDVIARHPRHPLAANAQYWIGEAYYEQRDYRQALVEFQKVLEYPNINGKSPDALLKMGLCYVRLREPARAREVWRRVLEEYPGSESAARARVLLQERPTARR